MTTRDLPLISVIMANYRGAPWIAAAIAAVQRQTHARLEVIVVDDASGDASVEIVKRLMAQDPRIALIEMPTNAGPSAARNAAIDAARGDWIAIVDSDDLIHPLRFAHLLDAADRLGADAIADDMIHFGDSPGVSGRTLLGPMQLDRPMQIDAATFVASNAGDAALSPLGYLKPMIRRAALGDLRYDPAIRVGEDYDLYLRLLLSGAAFHVLPESYYLYRRHSSSLSHRLSVPALAAMLTAHDACAGGLDAGQSALVRQMTRRRARLLAGIRFEHLVAAIKGRRWAAALGLLARDPAMIQSLLRSLRERRMARSAPDSGPRLPHRLVLTDGTAPLPPALAVVERITLPALTEDGRMPPAPDLWSHLSDLSARHKLDVVADGPAGLFALWNMPPPAQASVILRDGEALLPIPEGAEILRHPPLTEVHHAAE